MDNIFEDASKLWAVMDKQGHINHTTINTVPEDAWQELIDQENCLRFLANCSAGHMAHGKIGIEQLEAEGYTLVEVSVVRVS